MKVGTDAVLLGAWVSVGNVKNILDAGTGCGVIALMLAQRSNAIIDAIDIDKNSAEQASGNFRNSPFSGRLHAHHTTLQEFKGKYDLIVSNPPFFSNSLLPPTGARQIARHTETLSYDDLLKATTDRLAVILPTYEGNLFREKAKAYGLFCNRSTSFYSRNGKPQERWLFEFSFAVSKEIRETLILYGDDGKWSNDYVRLTESFYLLKNF
jgi:tRNA1Val (adenine37-N6)-methyltransferase